jgi:hypothetical protein
MQTGEAAGPGSIVVGMSLMKGAESAATVEYFREEQPEVAIFDRGTYFRFEAESLIRLETDVIAEYLGAPLSMNTFLGLLSSYFGRIDVAGDVLTITTDMLMLGDSEARAG